MEHARNIRLCMRDGIKILVKAPSDVESYSIKEGVHEIAEEAFKDCVRLKSLSVPYTVMCFDIDEIWTLLPNKNAVVAMWDWPHDCCISDEMVRDIDEGWTDEQGFTYSKDRRRLLRAAPRVEEYFIHHSIRRIKADQPMCGILSKKWRKTCKVPNCRCGNAEQEVIVNQELDRCLQR